MSQFFDAPFLHIVEFQDACKALEYAGFEAFAVGGCVRDAIADYPCADIDIATDATPDQVTAVAEQAGFAVYPTGIEHGTLTIKKGEWTFEVTTYRHDVATDGRRATVQFAQSIAEDAQRRDFTMNALYMDCRGEVLDPTGLGLFHLTEGLVVFVGNAEDRCKEDYLRIMRLFRFHAKYGGEHMDCNAANAAKKYAHMLPEVVSGERIWSELQKLLDLPEPYEAVVAMDKLGVLSAILPDARCSTNLRAMQTSEKINMFPPSWRRRFFTMNGAEIPFPHAKTEKRYLDNIQKALDNGYNIAVTSYLFGPAVSQDVLAIRGKIGGWSYDEAMRGQAAKFPVAATDLMQLGVVPGPEMGKILRQAEDIWIETSLTATKEELLEMVLDDRPG